MRPFLSALMLATLTAATAAPARAAAFDDLLACVPAKAALVVGIDHTKLSKHPHYDALLQFMASQGWMSGLDRSAPGLAPGKDIKRSITFRMPNDVQGTVVKGDAAALRAHYEKALGAGFTTATHAEKTYFSVDTHKKKNVAVSPGGGCLFLGPERLVKQVIDVQAAGKKSVAKRAGFKKLKRQAAQGGPPVWAVAFVPKKTRDRLTKQGAKDMAQVEKIVFNAKGKKDMVLTLHAFTGDEAGAKQVADGINGKIERKIMGSTVLKALGVAALAKRVEVAAKGKKVLGKLTLTEPQVGLFAKLGGRILKVLK